MPFLDPEELKPKLREVFENVVVPQIIKAKIMDTELTAVNSLIETLLPFIDRSRVSDTMLHAITEIHVAMEKAQMSNAMLHGWRKALDEEVHSIDPNDFYNKTFKSE